MDGEPVVWIRPGQSEADSGWAAYHEAVHVRQAAQMGCNAWKRMLRTADGLLQIEAEAYCSDIRGAARRTGASIRSGADLVVGNLMLAPEYRRVRALGRERVEAAVDAACGL